MPTDKHAPPQPPPPHEAVIVWGEGTYGVTCSAHDFFLQTKFATEAEARQAPEFAAHLEAVLA